MPVELINTLAFLGLVLLYGILVVGSIEVARRRRKTKWPFKDSDKLLRGPGETLHRQVLGFDERFVLEFFGLVMAICVGWPAGLRIAQLIGLRGWWSVALAGAALLALMITSVWRVLRLWQQRSTNYHGWFGERVVAEKLRPLLARGYHVFHDVPFRGATGPFNIDHVAVGRAGVTVVEVKTRRKGNARPGFAAHEIKFDGQQIIFPWGEDRGAIEQTLGEAESLRKWIHERTGLTVPVKSVLTFPGWYVKETPNRAIRVVNPQFLPDAIDGRGEQMLKDAEIDLIARQLEVVCRDVEAQ